MKSLFALALAVSFALPAYAANTNQIRVAAPISKAPAVANPGNPEAPVETPVPADPEPPKMVGQQPSTEGLQVLFRFNGSVIQEGGWGSGMAIKNGGVVPVADSPFNDGGQSIRFSSNGLFNANGPIAGTGPFSLGLWVKTTSPSGYLLSQRDAQNTGQYVLYISAGKVCYYDFPSGVGVAGMCSATTVSDGEWHHIGFSRSGTTHALYVDGVVSRTVTTGAANNMHANNGLTIAYDQRDNNKYVAMNTRDAFVFSRALKAEEFLWLGVSKKPFP